jgi:competence protein ComEC
VPTVTAAVLAYAAGLAGAFAGWAAASLAAAALLLGWAGLRREARVAVGALCGIAGVASAAGAERDRLACAAAVAASAEHRVALFDSAAPGLRVRGTLAGPSGCAADLWITVREGRAGAGAVATVTGVALPAGRGFVVRRAAVRREPERRPLLVWRARAAGSIDLAFRRDAALARALLVGDTRDLDDGLRERFAAAGLVHVLSISGLHVAILAAALELLLVAARTPPAGARVAAGGLAWLYVALIGLPAPAVRAATMLSVTAASRLAQRPVSPWTALAIGAGVPLAAAPRVLLDAGFQLSVAGMAALVVGGIAARRHLQPRLRGWRRAAAGELATSALATVVTAPIVAWWFGAVSLVGPLASVAAAPVVALLQPALFLALLCAPLPGVARHVAAAAHPLLLSLDAVARTAAALPAASVPVPPTAAAVAIIATIAAAVVGVCLRGRLAPWAHVAAAAAGVAAWQPGMRRTSGELELHMLDVGQGDALALRTPAGRWVLFDAGPAWRRGDAGARTVVPYLRRRGGALAAFVLSHPHLDHVGGAAAAVAALRPAEYWDGGYPAGGEHYRASLAAVAAAGARWRRARPGDSLVVDGVVVEFLAPDSAWAASLDDANDASTVALVRFGAVRFLLVGDAEQDAERWLLAHARGRLAADVLKVGHHGSATSSAPAFLAAVRPRLALVSVGLGNDYGHPSPQVMARLARSGAEVLRSDLLGTIVVRTDGQRLTVHAADHTWLVSPASSAASPPR